MPGESPECRFNTHTHIKWVALLRQNRREWNKQNVQTERGRKKEMWKVTSCMRNNDAVQKNRGKKDGMVEISEKYLAGKTSRPPASLTNPNTNVPFVLFRWLFFLSMPSGFFWWGRPICTCQPRSEDSVIKHTADCSAQWTKVTGTDALAVISRTERESGQKRMHIMREDTHTHTHTHTHLKTYIEYSEKRTDSFYVSRQTQSPTSILCDFFNSISSVEVFVWILPEDEKLAINHVFDINTGLDLKPSFRGLWWK